MKIWLRRGAILAAFAFLILTVVNASWLAPEPKGSPKLIAHRGVYQLYDKTGVGRDTCTADRIEEPFHGYLENTQASTNRAHRLGAHMVEIDVAPTKDGEMVVFHDWALDCRTNGSGPVRDATLEELQALDIGYGYTADGGQTYPFRGKGVGLMPEVTDFVSKLRPRARLMFNFKSKDASEADLLASKLRAAGRDPVAEGDGFYGHEAPIRRMRELFPDAWVWNQQEAKACAQSYVAVGWSGYLPQDCRGKTMVIPLNYQWAFWGWPNRLIARMEAHGGEVIVIGPTGENNPRGLTLPEQLTEIPSTFNGYIWVEDAFALTPALISRLDNRTQEEIDATKAALERRRNR